MQDRGSFYRARAEECREQAAKTSSQSNREAWLKLAADWLELADSATPNREPSRRDRTEVVIEFDQERKVTGNRRA